MSDNIWLRRRANSTLSSGEVRDFPDAIRLVQQACTEEIEVGRYYLLGFVGLSEEEAILNERAQDARTALVIYNTHLAAARAAAALEMRATSDELGLFAEALESDDFSLLAL